MRDIEFKAKRIDSLLGDGRLDTTGILIIPEIFLSVDHQ
mgnify:CR=1 FL=1